MNTESVMSLMGWYHNDESQLIVLMGMLLGTAVAVAAVVTTSLLAAQAKVTLGAFGAVAYGAILAYSMHLSHRMESIRHQFAGKVIEEDIPVAYINHIVGTDWNVVPTFMIFFCMIPVVLIVAFLIAGKLHRVPMPKIQDATKGRRAS